MFLVCDVVVRSSDRRVPAATCVQTGADGVVVVCAGGAGGEDDHLAGLIGESFEHVDALPSQASPHDANRC